jgi:hypothetical protein
VLETFNIQQVRLNTDEGSRSFVFEMEEPLAKRSAARVKRTLGLWTT